jgi:hypothetical protein
LTRMGSISTIEPMVSPGRPSLRIVAQSKALFLLQRRLAAPRYASSRTPRLSFSFNIGATLGGVWLRGAARRAVPRSNPRLSFFFNVAWSGLATHRRAMFCSPRLSFFHFVSRGRVTQRWVAHSRALFLSAASRRSTPGGALQGSLSSQTSCGPPRRRNALSGPAAQSKATLSKPGENQ